MLRLVVTDNRNPPLNISGVQYAAPAREVVFARNDFAGPLRLYVGNPKAEAPQYDFEKNLPAVLAPAPLRVEVGLQTANPAYRPEPQAVYGALALAALRGARHGQRGALRDVAQPGAGGRAAAR